MTRTPGPKAVCALLPLSGCRHEHLLHAHSSSAHSEVDSLRSLWAGLVLDAGPSHPEPKYPKWLCHDGTAVALQMSESRITVEFSGISLPGGAEDRPGRMRHAFWFWLAVAAGEKSSPG